MTKQEFFNTMGFLYKSMGDKSKQIAWELYLHNSPEFYRRYEQARWHRDELFS